MMVVDIDGYYYAQKQQWLQRTGVNVASLGLPPISPTGWKAVTETNFKEVVEEMPRMLSANCFQVRRDISL